MIRKNKTKLTGKNLDYAKWSIITLLAISFLIAGCSTNKNGENQGRPSRGGSGMSGGPSRERPDRDSSQSQDSSSGTPIEMNNRGNSREMRQGKVGWSDVHGAGSQRSDPKSGSLSEFTQQGNGYYHQIAPQGDAIRINNFVRLVRDIPENQLQTVSTYQIVDTGQTRFFNDKSTIAVTPQSPDRPFYGQDAQFTGKQSDYTVSKDKKTVNDNITELIWMRGPNTNLAKPKAKDKLSFTEAAQYVKKMNRIGYGGYSDWRLPSIKELYSLILFSGIDVSGYEDNQTSQLTPFIDNKAFNYAYGDTNSNERIIDAQYLSSNVYVTKGDETLYFGVNFADGRIKGYGSRIHGEDKTFFVQLVRGNTQYGKNKFINNNDKTITDSATSMMWSQDDSGYGMNWKDALAWVQQKNKENYLGYSDWRLPNAKEMQSIVDYSHAPGFDNKPAIDTNFFTCTTIKNEESQSDYPWYWTGTTHANWQKNNSGSAAVYIAFGRSMGYSDGQMPGPPQGEEDGRRGERGGRGGPPPRR